MSRNGSGIYNLPTGNPVVTGTTITSNWANTTLSDISTALTGSVAADGQTPITGDLQMGGNKVTGLGTPTSAQDAVTKAYADASIAGLGTMATQNANNVSITGGNISISAFAATSADINGIGSFVTPNTGTTGGVRIRENSAGGSAIIQFVNNAGTAEYSDISATSSNVLNLTSTGGVKANGSAITTISQFSKSLTTNGYQYLPGGLIMQWGTTSTISPGYGTVTVTFPVAFTTSCFNVQVTPISPSPNNAASAPQITSTSATQTVIQNTDPDSAYTAYWYAIGY